MEKEMRVLYIEGGAIHGGPESCVGVPVRAQRSVDRGRVGGVIEPRNLIEVRGADVLPIGGRQHRQRRYRESLVDPARSESPGTHASLHAREPGDPVVARGRRQMARPGWFAGWWFGAWRAVRGTLRRESPDARSWGVRRGCSTGEAAEQARGF